MGSRLGPKCLFEEIKAHIAASWKIKNQQTNILKTDAK